MSSSSTPPSKIAFRDFLAARWSRKADGWSSVISLVATAAGGIGLSRGGGWPFWIGAGVVLVAAGIQIVQYVVSGRLTELAEHESQRQAAIAEQESSDAFATVVAQQDLMSDLLGEVGRSAAAMLGQPKIERSAEFRRLAQQVVDSARAAYADVPGFRCVMYSLDAAQTSLCVTVWAAVGHRDRPNDLVGGTERGDRAVQVAHSGQHLFVRKISDASEQWKGSGVGYDTFLSIPIRSTTKTFGLLTVDAPLSGDITPAMVATWRLAAAILATIFALRDGRDSTIKEGANGPTSAAAELPPDCDGKLVPKP